MFVRESACECGQNAATLNGSVVAVEASCAGGAKLSAGPTLREHRVSQSDVDAARELADELERALDSQDAAAKIAELEAKICRLQNHVIAVDKENAALREQVTCSKCGGGAQ